MRTQTQLCRAAAHALLVLTLCTLTACGGGGGGGSGGGPPNTPITLSYTSPQTYTVGVAITPLQPTAQGSITSYSVSPNLPAGLALDSSTGRISGTPTTPTAIATYIITAQGSSGSTTFSLSLKVVIPAPSGLSYPSPNTYAKDSAIQTLVPTVQGAVTSYSVSPGLPAGLSIDAASGAISGTPSAAAAATQYTVTAANSTGSTSFVLSITVAAVNVTPTPISRQVAAGSPITIALVATPVNFSVSGTLYATATDASGVFVPAVAVISASPGYQLSLTVSASVTPGHYQGTVQIDLCADSSCGTHQAVPSVSVPFDVNVLTSTSAWPGNNLSALVAWQNVADWTMYQGNAAHTGYVPVDLDPNQFSTRWQVPASSISVGFISGIPSMATSGGKIFLSAGTIVRVLAEDDASAGWQYDFSGLQFPSVNPPAVANGVVYVAAGQQSSTYMFGLDASQGTVLFKSPMSSQWENYLAPTIGPQGVYTNAGTYGGIFGFTATGTQLFFDPLAQQSVWTPAADATHVYTYTGDALKVLDPTSGAVSMTIPDPTFANYIYEIGGSAVLGAPGSVFAANYANSVLNGGATGNTLLDFDTTHGTVAWKVAGVYPTTPAYNAGVVYAANENPVRLEARAEADGSLVWSWTPPQAGDTKFASEVLLTHNMLFVSTNLAIYGVDLASHQTVWSYPLVGRLALSQNGILYIESNGQLTAINLK
jgi:hypothetical protein